MLLEDGRRFEGRKRGKRCSSSWSQESPKFDINYSGFILQQNKKNQKTTNPNLSLVTLATPSTLFVFWGFLNKKEEAFVQRRKITFKAKNLMNLSRSFLSWELRSVSIAYGNLKYSTGLGMKSSFSFLFRFQNIFAIRGHFKRNYKNQSPLPVKS